MPGGSIIAWKRAPGPLAVFLFALVLLAAAVPLLARIHQSTTGDGADYVRMARDPGVFPEAPEAFRFLAPWLASLLPGAATTAFIELTVVALAATAALLFVWLRDLGTTPTALWGVAAFLCSGATVGAARNPYLVDPVAFAFAAAAFLLLWRGRYALLALCLGVGVLAKETVLFVAVAVAGVGYRTPRRVAALVAVPVVVYAAIHLTPLVYSYRGNHSYVRDIRGVFRYERTEVGVIRAPVQAILYSFGPLWGVAALGFRHAERRLRIASLYVVPVVASVVIAADWPRVLGFAFPIVVALACAFPLGARARVVVVVATLCDTLVFESLSSSAAKQALLLAAFVAGVTPAVIARRRARRAV